VSLPEPLEGVFRLVRQVVCPCGHPAASFTFAAEGGENVFRVTCEQGHAHVCHDAPSVEELIHRADLPA
jgi:cytochrome c5